MSVGEKVEKKERIGFRLPDDLIEAIRSAAFHSRPRRDISQFAEEVFRSSSVVRRYLSERSES